MLERLHLTLVLTLLLAACGEPPGTEGEPAADDVAPQLELADGGVLAPADLRGRWLFVNYWAEWCAPCIEEIPALNELDRDAAATVVGINFDQLGAAELAPQIAALGIEFPVAIGAAAELLDAASPQVVPSTYVFAPDGSPAVILRGPQTLEQFRAVMVAPAEPDA